MLLSQSREPRRVNLGCGATSKDGYLGVDAFDGPTVQVRADASHLPFRTGSIDEVYASHVIEHVPDLRALMQEIHRVLADDGVLVALVPYGLRSLYDPFHLHAFDMDTFGYFCHNGRSDKAALLDRLGGASTVWRSSSQRVGLFHLDEQRLDTISQFSKFIPRLHDAYENGSRLARLIRDSQKGSLFRLLPKGRWPQLVVRLRKVAA